MSKIIRIKSHSAPVFVPLTDELRALPIQPGKWYVCLSSGKVAVPTILDSDYDSKELFDEYLRQFSHVAIIDKPKELPKEVAPDMVWTEEDEDDRDKRDLALGTIFEHEGKTYRVVLESSDMPMCRQCAFWKGRCTGHGGYRCYAAGRKDHENVVFKEVKKGGKK